MIGPITLHGQIFHQVFWTILSFLIFYQSFALCFKNPVLSSLKLRSMEKNLLKDLIEKENNEKKYFDEKKIFLKKSKKDKIDGYVFDALSKDEKNWHELLFQARLEYKSLISSSSFSKEISDETIDSVCDKIVKRFS